MVRREQARFARRTRVQERDGGVCVERTAVCLSACELQLTIVACVGSCEKDSRARVPVCPYTRENASTGAVAHVARDECTHLQEPRPASATLAPRRRRAGCCTTKASCTGDSENDTGYKPRRCQMLPKGRVRACKAEVCEFVTDWSRNLGVFWVCFGTGVGRPKADQRLPRPPRRALSV